MNTEDALSPEILDDPNHWNVRLRGLVGGAKTYRNYHLAAQSRGEAAGTALRKWGGEFTRSRSWTGWSATGRGAHTSRRLRDRSA